MKFYTDANDDSRTVDDPDICIGRRATPTPHTPLQKLLHPPDRSFKLKAYITHCHRDLGRGEWYPMDRVLKNTIYNTT